ncbi:hypothetical protein D3C85_13850 [compost metagenome]
MLNSLAIEAALPIAQRLDERKLRILPNDNTPLMSLTLATDNTFVENSLAENADVVAVLQGRSNSDMHRVAKADIVKLASISVSRLHDMIRNTILPHIKRVSADVQSYVNARRVEAILPYSVEMKEIPAVYSNPAMRQLISRYPANPGNEFVLRACGPQLDLDAVKSTCMTGMAGVDSELAVVLSLNNNEGYAAIQAVLHGQIGPRQIHDDFLPGLLVAAQAIYNEPGAGVSMTLGEYNDYINALLGVTAFLANAAWIRYETQEKLGLVYSQEPRGSLTSIKVMGKVYRKMLEQGLTPETLIANEMSGRRFSQGQLIENKAALEQIYNREMNLRALKAQAEMAGHVRAAVRQIVGGELSQAEMEADARESANKVLLDMVGRIHERNCDDISQVITEVICAVFYPKADALSFIMLMNRSGRSMGDDADPREVALMATIRYVNRWLCRQLGLIDA